MPPTGTFFAVASVAALIAAFAAPRPAHACSPRDPGPVARTLAIPHDGQTIPSNGGILLAATGPATDLDRIAASVDVSVTDAKGAVVAGSLVVVRSDAKSVNAGTLSHSTLLFRPGQQLASGERYAVRASFKSPAGSTAPAVETSGEIIVGPTPLHVREPAAIATTLTSQTALDSSKPQTCCAIEPTPPTDDGCSSPNGGPSSQCFWSSLTAYPRVDVEIDTGLSEIESAFLHHEVFIVEGGVKQPRETQTSGSTKVRAIGVWSLPATEYCVEVVTRNLLDAAETTTTTKRCVPHGELSLVPLETAGFHTLLKENLVACLAPPAGAAELEPVWCEAHATDERCATGKYVPADDGGGCSANGRPRPTSPFGALLLVLGLASVALRQRAS